MRATLYVVPGSHPSMAGRLMLEHKAIEYRRVDLLPGLHKPILRLLRFSQTTVPALRIDRRRLQNTLTISRALDELVPDRPLFPVEPELRAAVEKAERWGEEVLQPVPRRLTWWAIRHDRSRDGLRTMGAGARLHVPFELAVRSSAPIVLAEVRITGATDEAARSDLAALPALLDQVDRWLTEGILGADAPNAADYQIATSLRLLLCFDDLRGLVSPRLAAYAKAVVPIFAGHIPATFPAAWLDQ